MDKQAYRDLVIQQQPKVPYLKNAITAFLVGGLIGALGQALMTLYMNWFGLNEQQAGTPMIVTLIAVACLLTGLGVFDKLAGHAGAGTFIPITGFANSMTSAALESRAEGLVSGVGSHMFSLGGTVITFGIVASFVIGVIRYVFFSG